MVEAKKKRGIAAYLPLLFYIVPIALMVIPIFPCFKDSEYIFVAFSEGQGISAASVSMYQAVGLQGGAVAALFYIGLVFATGASIFGSMPVFLPKLLNTKYYRPVVSLSFFFAALSMSLSCVLLALGVEQTTADYFESVGRAVERTSGFLHADLTFFFEMVALPFVFLWWIWAALIDYRAYRQSKKEEA